MMPQTVLPFKLETTDEQLTAHGGGNRNFKRPFCLNQKVSKTPLRGQFANSVV